jgi:fermentation-respiration switch protein FrsA (DUF1100 family)
MRHGNEKLSSKSLRGALPLIVMRMLLLVIASLAVCYLLLLAYVYVKQGEMLYFPAREIEATPYNIGLDYQDLTLRTKDGVDISAWYIPAEDARGFLLFCHGNAGNISHRLDSIRIFHSLGLSVLIFDYRGYGKSRGSPDEEGTYRDAEAAWDYLVNVLHVRPEKIVLFGRSLGGAVAAELALRNHAGALIMESGFTSVPDLGKKFFPHLPVRLISRYHYESINKVERIKLPKLFIHSPEDEIVPYEQGARLFERAREPKELLKIVGGHNEGFLLSGKVYVDGLDAFISRYLPD